MSTKDNRNDPPKNAKEWRHEQVQREQIQTSHVISHVHSLMQEHGMVPSEGVLKKSKKLSLPLTVSILDEGKGVYKQHPSRIVPCSVRTKDGKILDPCLLLFSSDSRQWPYWKDIYVGGQIEDIEPSEYTMPKKIIERASSRERPEIKMDTYVPLSVVFPDAEYLIPVGSYFFSTELHAAADLEKAKLSEPDIDAHRKGEYVWADNFQDRIQYFLCADGEESLHV